jgi:hypothetical protein
MGERRGIYRVLARKSGEIDYLEDPGLDGKIILKWIFNKWNGGDGIWLRIGTS